MSITTRYAQEIPKAVPAAAPVVGKEGKPGKSVKGDPGEPGASAGGGGVVVFFPADEETIELDLTASSNFRIFLPADSFCEVTTVGGTNGKKFQVSLIQPSSADGSVSWAMGYPIHWQRRAAEPVLSALSLSVDTFGFEVWEVGETSFLAAFVIGVDMEGA